MAARRTPRRRDPVPGPLGAVVGYCADHPLAISPAPRPYQITQMLSRVDAAAGAVPPGQHLRWLASDLAAARHDASRGQPLGEADDLYAALAAVSRSPFARCVTLGPAPP
ncbi:MAG TPA: hypothetical protein VFA11_17170 [Acidimicrobiales bacterium]|nr:hypothetical protein [Acidimicrobiales bacterium]